MFVGIVVGVLLGAAPIQLAAAHVTVTGLYNQRGETFLELATKVLVAGGVTVITPAQASARLGHAKKAELFACEERCAPAFGEALGVQGVLEGSIRSAGPDGLRVTLRVVSTESGQPLSTFFEGGVDEGRVSSVVEHGAKVLAADLSSGELQRLAISPAVHASTTSPALRKVGWGLLALAVVGAAGGTGVMVRRADVVAEAESIVTDPGNAATLRTEASQLRALSIGSFCVSGLALVASAILLGLGFAENPVSLGVGVEPGGAMLGVRGAF